MNGHLQFDEDFDLYALGALDAEERQTLEVHFRSCADCAGRLAEAQGRVAVLGLAAPAAVPAPGVRERLLQQAGTRSAAQAERQRSGFGTLGAFRRWATPVLALATLVLAIAVGVLRDRNRTLDRRLAQREVARKEAEQRQEAEIARARAILAVLTSPDTAKVTLVAAGARPLPEGKAFYHSQKGLLFYVANLPALPSDHTYQLWLVPETGNPISAGVFSTDQKGNGEVLLPPLPPGLKAKLFAVTVEPAGGRPQPTGQKVLIGAVS